ncbi:hypothetical protein [Bryobacter aggregatus]|uniref:IS66 family transposase n=1 Tax=Bryobacter aggregatus TaxID=360054 RepID=UPI0004E1652F|nr:hypothetical protein [Bryobacter aggregatus]
MSQLATGAVESQEVLELRRRLRWAELKIEQLEEKLRLARILKYGPSSEKLNDAQLLLLEGEPGVSQDEVLAESIREAMPSEMPVEKPRSQAAISRRRLSHFQLSGRPPLLVVVPLVSVIL